MRPGPSSLAKRGLAAFDFAHGTLSFTEAGSKRRASLYLVEGESALAAHDPGGVEVLDIDIETFRRVLTSANHTLKRALTDPRLFSGIGNAYSDEILHRARLSPLKWTRKLDAEESARLHAAVRETLADWIERLRTEAGEDFPEKVTAFRKDMAVPWSLRPALSDLWRTGAAHRLRLDRDELLCDLSDWRQAARRPRPIAPPQEGLAANPGGARGNPRCGPRGESGRPLSDEIGRAMSAVGG